MKTISLCGRLRLEGLICLFDNQSYNHLASCFSKQVAPPEQWFCGGVIFYKRVTPLGYYRQSFSEAFVFLKDV